MKLGSRKYRGLMPVLASALACTAVAWAARDTVFFVSRVPGKPTYWIAILAVPLSEPEKERFHPHLADFWERVANLLGPGGTDRCKYSKMKTNVEQACMEQDKVMLNCEALEVHWNDDPSGRQGKLSLWVQESSAAHSQRRGELGHHYCAPDATFEECFAQQWEGSLAPMVQEHDAMCHEGSKCIVENGQFRPEQFSTH
jgi:hypothetical protein